MNLYKRWGWGIGITDYHLLFKLHKVIWSFKRPWLKKYLSSRNGDPLDNSQGPESVSGQFFICMWAIIKTKQNKNMLKTGSWTWDSCYLLRRKEGPSTVCVCACPCTCPGMVCLGLILCIKVAAPCPVMCLGSYTPYVSSVGSNVPQCCIKLRNTKPTQNTMMFSYKSQVASCTEYAFFCEVRGGTEIVLHVQYRLITCLY